MTRRIPIFEYNEAGNGGAIQVDAYSGLTLTNSVVSNNNGTVYFQFASEKENFLFLIVSLQ